ncbi:MAG: urate oxidase, partial [Verrucomicrobiota bacterium]|nr:urate oxidase [Verrucomicrobiota bacterium]
MKLSNHRYGKARVRVFKILRAGDRHTIKEIEVKALLRGDFESSYLAGDNSKVVATDTIKNTVNIFAKKHLGAEIESFALTLAEHFLANYEQVHEAEVEIAERDWQPMEIDGKPHEHSFVGDSVSRRFTRVTGASRSHVVQSGVRELVILKSSGSGFEGYPKDEFTTLPETADRILATS